MNKVLAAGSTALLLLVAAVTVMPAVAEEGNADDKNLDNKHAENRDGKDRDADRV